MEIVYSDELSHHGILGQKWGIRRFQNPDGSLTAAGRKRYEVDVRGATVRYKDSKNKLELATAQYRKDTNYGSKKASEDASQKYNIAINETKYAKEDLKNEKIKAKLNAETKKSKHRLKLEEHYRAKGMTEEEAAIAAYKRARTEKIIAATAGVAIASAAAYVAYKHYDDTVDKILKSGLSIQTVGDRDASVDGVKDAFYFAYRKGDKQKYRGIYGEQLYYQKLGAKLYTNHLKLASDAKIASNDSGRKALKELIDTDPQFRSNLVQTIANNTGQLIDLHKVSNDKKELNKIYETVNTLFTYHDNGVNQKVTDSMYNKLRSMGYDGIVDINDTKYSGYDSKAVILINKAKAVVDKVQDLDIDQIERDKQAAMGKLYAKQITKGSAQTIAMYAPIGAAIVGVKKKKQTKRNDEIVRKYRKEHPGTKMSYTEILRSEQNRMGVKAR